MSRSLSPVISTYLAELAARGTTVSRVSNRPGLHQSRLPTVRSQIMHIGGAAVK